ncbi:MAG: transglycosylase SLT domain-containing protein [Saprospiraceae bacterium]|nr:transglycosylase SLT domain-containing protein [Saprospiraceae bacterium]HMW39673.1 transglycosylase SLT domain-containing protein [Saprospiraceae bacterium]HMX89408.1 transglycosylase SLT domain-containing protein [Saprospiraceae bacterium]HMZ40058.1 transglycosylase SLT domain-containing protein [Saprospiraceae bacterium]HNA64478.1 transglycosylase SLT domain-containing protein [Saprospiraceae bacterium]
MKVRYCITMLLVFLLSLSRAEYTVYPHLSWSLNEKILFNFYEEEVTERLRAMNSIVTVNLDEDVFSQVRRFVVLDRGSSKSILYRSELYFPLIERLLFDNNLPFQLKNLAVLESALNPEARSYAGAAGMWQLMPETARNLGLRVNKNIDERKDPVASTRAAITYLKKLFGIFNDWALVLAAYNCGENKILNIMEETGLTRFDEIKKYLPKQTQQFIPTFIGASYLMEFYGEHDLFPDDAQLPGQYLTYVSIDRKVNMNKMFRESGVDQEIFKKLNPSFRTTEINPGKEAVFICLPDSMMVEFVDYYLKLHRKFADTSTIVEAADHSLILELISFSRPYIDAPENVEPARDEMINYRSTDYSKVEEVPSPRVEKKSDEIIHILRTGESLSDVAEQYPQVTIAQLMSWNGLREFDFLLPGKALTIRK